MMSLEVEETDVTSDDVTIGESVSENEDGQDDEETVKETVDETLLPENDEINESGKAADEKGNDQEFEEIQELAKT